MWNRLVKGTWPVGLLCSRYCLVPCLCVVVHGCRAEPCLAYRHFTAIHSVTDRCCHQSDCGHCWVLVNGICALFKTCQKMKCRWTAVTCISVQLIGVDCTNRLGWFGFYQSYLKTKPKLLILFAKFSKEHFLSDDKHSSWCRPYFHSPQHFHFLIFSLFQRKSTLSKSKPSLRFLFPFALYKWTMNLKISSKSLNCETIKFCVLGAGSSLHV